MDFIRQSRATEECRKLSLPSYFTIPNFRLSHFPPILWPLHLDGLKSEEDSLFPLSLQGSNDLGVGVTALSANVFYQVRLSTSSFFPSPGHLPIFYYLIFHFWEQNQVLVDLSPHLKSINAGQQLMDGNGPSQRNISKRFSSELQAPSRSEEELWYQ